MRKLRLEVFEGAAHGGYIAKWIVDPDYKHFFQGIGIVPTMVECIDYPRWTGHSIMMICLGDMPVGMVCMYRPCYRNGTCEVGILIDKGYHRGGLALEAGTLWLEFLLSLGFRKVIAHILDDKLCSVMNKHGWALEGVHESESLVNGEYIPEYRLAYIRGLK